MANPLTFCLFPIQNVMTAGVRRRIGVGVALLVVAIAPPLFGFQALLGPNVFTMVMFGIEVAVLNTLFGDIWLGLFAPAGTPDAIVVKLREAVQTSLAKPDVAAKVNVSGSLEPLILKPDVFADLIRSDNEKFRKLIKELNIKVN